MASSTRAWRGVAAAVVAAAVGSVGAATAQAATVTVGHDTAADFRGGSGDTVVRERGSVELARTLEEQFAGALPATWTSTPWAAGGAATVAGGAVLVDGTHLNTGVTAGPGSTLEFRADFETAGARHVGFASSFADPPWAIFSTGSGSGLFARTSDGDPMTIDLETPITGLVPGPHDFRIEKTAAGFVYSVDGNAVATHAMTLPDAPVGASDFNVGSGGILIDSMTLSTHKSLGTYSHVLDAGDANVTAVTLTPTSDLRPGTNISFETRTGDTPVALGLAAYTPLPASGVVANPKRYVEYRATLTTTDPLLTPSLDKVEATFTVADPKPPGSTGTPPGSNPSGNVPDRTKPKVLLLGRSLRVNKSGVAKLKIRCPQSEKSCKVAVKLKLRGKRIASKSKTLSSGATGTFRLKLSSSARIKLAARSSLSASAVVSAEDAAGNRRKTKHKVTLLAPGR